MGLCPTRKVTTQMMDQIFFQSIQQTFPKLNKTQQEEIYKKVSLHILEVIKATVYENNPEGLNELNRMVETEQDETKRSKEYAEQIFSQFASLPAEQQEIITKELDQELVRVMHALYKAYE